jgi:hypothetical protein
MTGASNKTVLIICIAVFFLMVSPVFAIDSGYIENNEVKVQYEASLQTVANGVIRIYSSVKREIENTFQSSILFKPTVLLIKDRRTFTGITRNESAVAVAVPGSNLIIIDNSKMRTHPFTLEVTLKHELCHLFLHNFVKDGDLPRWFNEGVSQWVSGGISELIIEENKNLIKQAVLTGRLISIRDLVKGFPADDKYLHLAYQQSRSIVDYIVKEFGEDGILQIMKHLKDGASINMAVLYALSMSINELEKNWHIYLKKKYTWYTYLSNHLYEILFSFAALALTYGFVRMLIRKRAYKDEEEEDGE